MPGSTEAKPKRVGVDLAPKSHERLVRLKEMTEAASFAEVFKNALRLYEYVVHTYNDGARMILVDKHGKQSNITLIE